MPTVLSVQSWVACGNVGNTAALFPLQRLGCETWSLNTVAFSNHTGYQRWRGNTVPASEIAPVSRERMIFIAWGSQHTVVSTAPVMPMVSTSKLFMEAQ